MAAATPAIAAAALWVLPFGGASEARRLELPILGPTHAVPGRHASVVVPPDWTRLPSGPEGAVLRFRCYTAAMFAYLPSGDQGSRIVVDARSRRAEVHRHRLALAFIYDVHRGCVPDDHRKAATDILALLRSFR
jgi:hypothetical protein